MTSAEIRQSFLDFFAKHQHTIVPSSSLMPDSPGLLFTNAGMNQFVPIFLNERKPDVASWAGAVPGSNTRAADTQKCIRAGGKHNDLEDVGWDTYHHTMFEMLGNWSFGDYFKKESLTWGWELLTKVWGIPAKRLFATVYAPDKSKGDPADFDQEAYDIWAGLFRAAGLDPAVHIVNGNKKDNFWMMGDTGPCGPCSEIHFNLLPSDDEAAGRALVNSSSPRCIEIWNHVFIQFNANADGTFSPLAAKHVDTGMGFERVAGIHATTKGFTDFAAEPSNYNADVFTSLFEVIARLSGKSYTLTVPTKREGLSEQEKTDIAFRVLADHARTVSCAIADGILPGNAGRNYVIRRILRRGILYGRKDLKLATGFFEKLVPAVVASLGRVFPELEQQQSMIERVIRSEEESFGRTLDRGIALFSDAAQAGRITATDAFKLYDTYGFPIDMTQLLAAERGLEVDLAGFEAEMEKARKLSQDAHTSDVVTVSEGNSGEAAQPTTFVGYDSLECDAVVTDVVRTDKDTFLVFDQTPFYGEMGGQAGDHGAVKIDGQTFAILDTLKDKAGRHLHQLAPACAADAARLSLVGKAAKLQVSPLTRRAISRHHSAAHLVHWALRKTLGTHVRQAGTSKTKERMRFDFSHFEQVRPEQLREIERLVNEKVIENAAVQSYETEFDKKPEGTLAFFGEKYGRIVRVVDIGGYSRELCGGTHVSNTGEIGPIKIVAEMAIASGTRRIEAVAGEPALDLIAQREAALSAVASALSAGPADVADKLKSLLASKAELEKQLKAFQQKAEAGLAVDLAAGAVEKDGLKRVVARVEVGDPNALRALGSQVLGKLGEGIVILGAAFGADKVSVAAFCSPAAVKAGHQAGKIVGEVCGKLGGKGGGKPDFAMGGGKDAASLDGALAALR
jgi:alanyl-tRNA synthetase